MRMVRRGKSRNRAARLLVSQMAARQLNLHTGEKMTDFDIEKRARELAAKNFGFDRYSLVVPHLIAIAREAQDEQRKRDAEIFRKCAKAILRGEL